MNQKIKKPFLNFKTAAFSQSGRYFLTFPSLIVLVVANSFPIIGVIFLGWSLKNLLLLYWIENGIIGFYNTLKMFLAPAPKGLFLKLFLINFFIGHYTGFMFVHLLFLLFFIRFSEASTSISPLPISIFSQEMTTLFPGSLILAVSHGFSFVYNYLSKEQKRATLFTLMVQPYLRIVFMHLSLIMGGLFVLLFRSPLPLLILLVILKIIVDILAHIKERLRFGQGF